jgi:tRNA G46 methylase TrmB
MVYLRTDDEDYFQQMRAVFDANASFNLAETPEALKALTTDFEREFTACGVTTLRAAYQRRTTQSSTAGSID